MTALFGPQNSNAATLLPSGSAQQRYGANQTWVQDCSAPGRNDGTVLDAAFYNRIIGNLDYLVSQSGVTATPGDFTAVYRAILGSVAQGAPEVLNSIKELADAIADDPNFASTILTQMSLRVRVDNAQNFSELQKQQALFNLGITIGSGPGQVLRLNSVGQLPGLDGSLLTGVTVTWGNVSGKPAFGTAALLDVGTTASKVVQLGSDGKLPILDGSKLTNVIAASASAVVFNTAQSLTDAQRLQAIANLGVPFEHGRLTFFTAASLRFTPFKGDMLKINGAVVRIPASGITGLANTGAFVNGLAAQNLAANTLYYVYAFLNSGVVTADFSTTGHSTSATAGNIGTEIKTGDDTRSLIGMVFTDASSQFRDALTATWFNRRTRSFQSIVATVATPGAYFLEVGGGSSIASPGCRVYFLVWGDENTVEATAQADVSVTASNNVGYACAIDGSIGGFAQMTPFFTTNHNTGTVSSSATLSEGMHYAVLFGGSNAGGTTQYAQAQTCVTGIRG